MTPGPVGQRTSDAACSCFGFVSKGLLIGVGITTAYVSAAAADGFPPALAGYSIVAERIEVIGEEPPFRQDWHERLYFSRNGRIFFKQKLDSGNPNNAGSLAMVSDQTYRGQAPFEWDGSGVARQWTNPRNGVVLTMRIQIAQSGQGYACSISLDRQGYPKEITLQGQSCRMYRGNAVAD